MAFEKGSEWRKWDLHIHTPYSKINDYTGGDWNIYFLQLAKITLQKKISVIGISDYWILDGYYKVREAWESNTKFIDDEGKEYTLSHIKQIFPLIEYRNETTVGNNKKLNIHYVFDPSLSLEKLKEIVTKIYITCDISGVKTQINGTYESIQNIDHTSMCLHHDNTTRFEEDPVVSNISYLKAIGYNELDSARWDEAPTIIRKAIDDYSFGFLASPKDKLNYGNKNKAKYILHSSDAHDYPTDINNTKSKELGHCFTWIKGEPSFDGLKYALEDPSSRIRIQEDNPFLEKTPPYIESVTFSEDLTIRENHKININQEIYFNRYMNSIIGGRGTGKTTLLEAINMLFDTPENHANITMKEGLEDSQRRKVHYISKDSVEKDNFSIEKYLEIFPVFFQESLLLDDPKIFEIVFKSDIKYYENLCKKSEETIKSYSNSAMQEELKKYDNYVKDNSEYLALEDELRILLQQTGFLTVINENIAKINENSKLEIKLTPIDVSIIKEIGQRQEDVKSKKEHIETEKNKTQKILEEQFPDKNITSITVAIQNEQTKSQEYKSQILNIENARNSYKKLILQIPSLIENYKNILVEEISSRTGRWEDKKKNHKHSELLKDLTIQTNICMNLDEFTTYLLESFLNNKTHNYDSIIQNLFEPKKDSAIKKYCHNSEDSWNFYGDLGSPKIQEFFDMLSLNSEFGNVLDFIFNSASKGGNEWEVRTSMLRYIYSLSYITLQTKLLYKGRDFDELSAGEKGVISLLINIDIGEGDIPILIDQPEDYLDNQFIHTELIPILQEIKEKRQVIMVSHNANLVVNGDSELVIIAKNISDNTGEFSYIEGCLESEILLTNEFFNDEQSMKNRICNIMEGGEQAFSNRRKKYGI